MQLTEEIIECLNVECPYSGFRFAFLPQSNSGEIILRNTDGIYSYIINITNDARVWIEEFFYKRYGVNIRWNNDTNIFYISE